MGIVGPAAWLLAGCSSGGGDLISAVALPPEQTAQAAEADGLDVGLDAAASPDRIAGNLHLTPSQRGYLDGLQAAGVRPSNDLRALSIGAYVCQARSAGQTNQMVWDAVAPMVRSDIANSTANSTASTPTISTLNTDDIIGQYIGVAQQRLC